jgi:large subunit ribosomal protein L6
MSRIGKLPVAVPSGVVVTAASSLLTVKGPKGELQTRIGSGVEIVQEAGVARVVRKDDDRQARANHGLMRSLLNNMVTGVTKGYERRLTITGVGFKGEIKGTSLVLNLGFSHSIVFPFPEGVTIDVEKATTLIVRGSNRELVGETCAKLRSFRPPDAYKGKGVRNEGEKIKLKAGKTAKK